MPFLPPPERTAPEAPSCEQERTEAISAPANQIAITGDSAGGRTTPHGLAVEDGVEKRTAAAGLPGVVRVPASVQ